MTVHSHLPMTIDSLAGRTALLEAMTGDRSTSATHPASWNGQHLKSRADRNPAKSGLEAVVLGDEHPRFGEHYQAARAGIQLPPEADAPSAIKGSVGWLVDLYRAAMKDMQDHGHLHKATAHQRGQFLLWLASEVGEYSAAMPQSQLILLRDKKAATPGAADNFIKAVRAMYAW